MKSMKLAILLGTMTVSCFGMQQKKDATHAITSVASAIRGETSEAICNRLKSNLKDLKALNTILQKKSVTRG